MINHLIDLTGQRFGIWIVREQAPRQDNKTRWLCECRVCGARVSHRSTALRKGLFIHCDGRHLRRPSTISPLRKSPGYAAETEMIGNYKMQARKRGLSFSLTREQFHDITARACHYCAAAPSQRHQRRHFNGAFIYNGIDRKDSGAGYEPDNCVPCCCTCNVMKQDLPYAAFLAHVSRIHRVAVEGKQPTGAITERMTLSRGGNSRQPVMAAKDGLGVAAIAERRRAVRALKDAGKNLEEIGLELNLSRMTVYRALTGTGPIANINTAKIADLPAGSFEASGTGVNTAMVVIEG